jgi:hypothetical protein
VNLNRKLILAGLAATGIAAGALSGGGVAFASTGPAHASATATTTAPASGWCGGGCGHMGGMWPGRQRIMKAAADYLGLSQAQLRSQLRSGKSLADVARAQRKPVSGLENAILAAITSWINASTRLSAAQKAAMISEVKSHLGAIVNMTCRPGMGAHQMGSPMRDADSPVSAMCGM